MHPDQFILGLVSGDQSAAIDALGDFGIPQKPAGYARRSLGDHETQRLDRSANAISGLIDAL